MGEIQNKIDPNEKDCPSTNNIIVCSVMNSLL
jgi:hypothetical protein